jgi:hypothetical protein
MKSKKPMTITSNKTTIRRKISKVTSSLLCIAFFLCYAYWYPAPNNFTTQNYLPALGFIALAFLATVTTVGIFHGKKISLLISSLMVATLLIKRVSIISILLFAIAIPLLFLNQKKQTNDIEETDETINN